jgi:dolichyl-phosphate beta-glucosyltransferase
MYHGHAVATGPWSWLDGLPLFDSVVPIRLGLMVVPVIAVLLAFSVDAALGYRSGVLWLAVLAVALVPILPARLPVTPRPPVPVFFTSGAWRGYVSGDRSVVSADTTVWYGGITAMRWDNTTRHGYRMVGGYFLGPDETGRGTYGAQARPTASLLSGVAYNGGVATVGPAERAQAIVDVRYWRAAIVVLAPDAPHGDDLHATLDELFGPGTRVADVWLWDVRRLL